jgi:hypothetical protein
VVFGKADWTGTPIINASSLDGSTGFRLSGVDDFNRSGVSVSSAGDLNDDGLDDLIIGAPEAGAGGQSYVVFGKLDWTGTPTLDLGSLDGTNGFRITSETGGFIGHSVRAAGDVNGDGISDIVVGAPTVEIATGESYVIFGKANWAGTPEFDVANLDGNNGFRLIGTETRGYSGNSVSSAGDFNGDGFDDLIIGAHRAGSAGNAYLVYGKANWAGTPTLDLGALDGTNGFVLIGAGDDPNILTGHSVASAGDVNNDGFDDLIIGAPRIDGGRSYVVFGSNFNGAAAVQVASADELSMP